MKAFLLLFILTCSLTAFSQEYKIPDMPFDTIKKKRTDYYKTLDIKDKNALILNAGHWGSFDRGLLKFIVYYNDGSVKKFTLDTLDKVTEISLTDQDKERYHLFLISLVTNDILKIDRYKLINRSSIMVLDGSTDYFSIYQNKKELHFSSHASEIYIKEKVPGWEERQKLLDLIHNFEALFNNN